MKIKRSAPLYRQILENLRKDIFCEYRPGEELPGDNELVKRLGVSSLTVREAMSVLGEEGFLERRVGSGTRVCVPRVGVHQVVAVLMDKDMIHPQFPMHFLSIYEYLCRAFGKQGLRVQLYTGRLAPDEFPEKISSRELIQDLKGGRIAAVVNLVGYPEQQYLDYAAGRNIPWVYFGNTGKAPIKIRSNMQEMLDKMIGQLASRGKRKAALLSWQGFWDTRLRDSERRKWFEAAVARHGMCTREEWIRMDLYPGLSGAGWDQIRTLWTVECEKPDALFFLDDMLFLDALPALGRLGFRIPEDMEIGVFTHRARQLEQLAPQVPLTIAEVCQEKLSNAACAQVMEALTTGIVQDAEFVFSAEIFQLNEQKEFSHCIKQPSNKEQLL